ncbi:oligosaccharide flippase family protein [Escherichia coli]
MNKRILSNSIWMMSEKIISLFGLIFVTSFVAKYVGAEVFGQIAFATSLFQIAMIIAQLGSDVIIFKRVSKKNRFGCKAYYVNNLFKSYYLYFDSYPNSYCKL